MKDSRPETSLRMFPSKRLALACGTFLLAILLLPPASIAKTGDAKAGNSKTVIEDLTITSSFLEESRSLKVLLPATYGTSNKDYPVLFILDGHRWFYHGVTLLQLFSEYEITPEFIVVGIETRDASRSALFLDADRLRDFLSSELIPFVENRYRTSEERILFGWQYAGAFAIETLASTPHLFAAILAASPFPLAGKGVEDVSLLLSSGTRLQQTLFVGTSPKEGSVIKGAEELAQLLESKAPASLKWTHQMVDQETVGSVGHRMTPLGTLFHGLRFHYSDYADLEFSTLAEFEAAGGLAHVKRYFQQRSKKYGTSPAVPSEVQFSLLRKSIQEDQYPVFESLMKEFVGMGLLESTRLSWGKRYAEFYLAHGNLEGARSVYQAYSHRFPSAPGPINGLGDISAAQGNSAQARTLYRKAIQLAKDGNDPRLGEYEGDLAELEAEH